MEKICLYCGKKFLDNTKSKCKLYCCKSCANKYRYYFNGVREKYKKNWIKNKEKIYKKNREWIEKNREKYREYGKKWVTNNREKSRKNSLDNYYKNRKINLKKMKNYRIKNKEKLKKLRKDWRKKNMEYIREYDKKDYNKSKGDNLLKLKRNLINNIKKHINYRYKKSKSEFINKNISEIKDKLEKGFTKKMSWENYATYWEIDHIIPISLSQTEKDIFILNTPINLRPLICKRNNIKSDKITKGALKIVKKLSEELSEEFYFKLKNVQKKNVPKNVQKKGEENEMC